jgi:hypothetical protein
MEIIQNPSVVNLILVISIFVAVLFLPFDFRFDETDADGEYLDID